MLVFFLFMHCWVDMRLSEIIVLVRSVRRLLLQHAYNLKTMKTCS